MRCYGVFFVLVSFFLDIRDKLNKTDSWLTIPPTVSR